jgi:hypothetical protein
MLSISNHIGTRRIGSRSLKRALQNGLQISITKCGETDPDDITQEFENDLSARGFLSDLAQDYHGRLTIRNALAELVCASDVSRLSDADVIARLAGMLSRGEARITSRTVETSHWLTDRVTAAASTVAVESTPAAPEEEQKSWIEIQMVDEADRPLADEKYRIVSPDGSVLAEGRTDADGKARKDNIDAGNYKVTFPDLDSAAWRRA